MALWNLKGKKLGAPVYSLLGGRSRDRVRVYFQSHGKSDHAAPRSLPTHHGHGMHSTALQLRDTESFEPTSVYRQPHQDLAGGRRLEVSLDALRKPPRWDSSVYVRDLLRVT